MGRTERVELNAVLSRITGRHLATAAVFAAVLAFFALLRPGVPFGRELATCECGAVRSVLAGHIILPRYDIGSGAPMIQTPPLFWWLAALSSRVLGWNEIALRLPSLGAGAATCAVLFAWVATSHGMRAALWSVALLTLSHYFIDAARQPRMDALLALFVTAATLGLERGLATARDRRRTVLLFGSAGVSMGLGTLAKGPLGIALPLIAVGFHLGVRRRWRDLMRPALAGSALIGAALGAAWYVAAFAAGGMEFLRWQVGQGLWGRFLGTAGSGLCPHPFWYFIPVVIAGFLPWSVYLPATVAITAGRRRRAPETLVFSICWFAATLAFFSSSHGKCLVYMLPGFPPLAAALGVTIEELSGDYQHEPFLSWLMAGGTTVVGAVAGLILLATGAMHLLGVPDALTRALHPTDRHFLTIFLHEGGTMSPTFVAWVVLTGLGVVLAACGVRRARTVEQVCGVFLISLAGTLLWFRGLQPVMSWDESLKDFSRAVDASVPPGAPIYFSAPSFDCDLRFYSSHEIKVVTGFRCGGEVRPGSYVILPENGKTRRGPGATGCLRLVAQSQPIGREGRRVLFQVMDRR